MTKYITTIPRIRNTARITEAVSSGSAQVSRYLRLFLVIIYYTNNSKVIGMAHWSGLPYISNYHLDFNYGWRGGVYDLDRVAKPEAAVMRELYTNLTKDNP